MFPEMSIGGAKRNYPGPTGDSASAYVEETEPRDHAQARAHRLRASVFELLIGYTWGCLARLL